VYHHAVQNHAIS
jgi:hypothetical protein